MNKIDVVKENFKRMIVDSNKNATERFNTSKTEYDLEYWRAFYLGQCSIYTQLSSSTLDFKEVIKLEELIRKLFKDNQTRVIAKEVEKEYGSELDNKKILDNISNKFAEINEQNLKEAKFQKGWEALRN